MPVGEPVGWCAVEPRPAYTGLARSFRRVITEELHVGTEATFAGAGLRAVTRPTKRRVVMRIDF